MLRPFYNLIPLSFISLPPPPFQVGQDQMYASMLIQEGQSLHLKCTLSVGTIMEKGADAKTFSSQIADIWYIYSL